MDLRIEEIRGLLPRCMLADWVRLGARLVRLLRDQRHPGMHDSLVDRLLERARASVALRDQRAATVPEITYTAGLPISARREEIVAAIRSNQVLIVAGETGSGKTTQLPKMCLEAGLGIEAKIGCTQPRRVAALSISRRIAEELNVSWGREVGCKIRFDDRSSPETFLKLMTDGILLAETQGDPLLSEYNALIIDEAHERSLNIDFLLGYLKGLLVRRPELKLIVTSATIDTAAFSQAFNNAPVIEVSGRVYPVEVVYAPFDATSEEEGEVTVIDAAVRAAEQVAFEPGPGDVLIFMPGERDIRETGDQLKTRLGDLAEIIPLFGRLSAGDQQRVFADADRRKIVIATNIAETSLTIPGIRYVIDSGLARISRYNPRTRTRRLPIEPVSQSSANQRKGRSGRVQNGICIRLYSEEDFNGRPPFTQPEIQRSNLAEVILRMKAFRLGEIETFPFLNPPSPAAIDGGYKLLQELGALDEKRELTDRGRDLARLPIDPTLGRMLLQSQHEHATRELLIIAAGLSIQDPRERPLDQKDTAAAAHKRFADPQSDFLTLLNIWNAVHEEWEQLRTQSARRKFCKKHFLSYLRMREWQDLYAQLYDALEDLGSLRLNESNASYPAIHRSILAGLLGHVALRSERNVYKGAGNRELMVFPGSVLYDRTPRQKPSGKAALRREPKPVATSQPEWVVAGEIVETSQLFARTLAGIDPLWIPDLAPHLVKITHHNPYWSAASGRVLAEERTTLFGLEVRKRKVAYGNINPKEATAIFVRAALVEENLFPEPVPAGREPDPGSASPSQLLAAARAELQPRPCPYPFIEHNRQVRQKVETFQTRLRRHDLPDLDQALTDFYLRHLQNVSSLAELNRFLGELPDRSVLHVTEAELAGGADLAFDTAAFPDQVELAGHAVPLSYAYEPGHERDGVTVRLDVALAEALPPATVEWSVPGLREAQVTELLRSLPKALRRQLMPFPPKVAEIMAELKPAAGTLKQELSRFIHRRYGVEVPVSAWDESAVPAHVRPRIEVVGHDRQPLGVGRNLVELRKQLEQVQVKPAPPDDTSAWAAAARAHERFGLTGWSFGNLPEKVPVTALAPPGQGDLPLAAEGWLGLEWEEGQVNVRLFRSREAALRSSLPAEQKLVEQALQKDLAWLQKDLRGLSRLAPLLAGFCSLEDLQSAAFEMLKRHLLPVAPFASLLQAYYTAAVERARALLPGLAVQCIDRLETPLKLRAEIVRRLGPAPAPAPVPTRRTLSDLSQLTLKAPAGPPKVSPFKAELEALLPKDLGFPYERLPDLARYLKALLTRAERAALNPVKDQERARLLQPYLEALAKVVQEPPGTARGRQLADQLRWMVEEYKVSLFAQELGTAVPVSPKRLDEVLRQLRQE